MQLRHGATQYSTIRNANTLELGHLSPVVPPSSDGVLSDGVPSGALNEDGKTLGNSGNKTGLSHISCQLKALAHHASLISSFEDEDASGR